MRQIRGIIRIEEYGFFHRSLTMCGSHSDPDSLLRATQNEKKRMGIKEGNGPLFLLQ